MRFRSRGAGAVLAVALCGVALVVDTSAAPPDAAADEVRSQLHAAMMAMDDQMFMPAKGSVDEAFVAMMVPHHQGAIDMARIQLRYSHNPQIIRICQEIIIEQQQEIAVMRRAVGVEP